MLHYLPQDDDFPTNSHLLVSSTSKPRKSLSRQSNLAHGLAVALMPLVQRSYFSRRVRHCLWWCCSFVVCRWDVCSISERHVISCPSRRTVGVFTKRTRAGPYGSFRSRSTFDGYVSLSPSQTWCRFWFFAAQQPVLEKLASDVTWCMNETVRSREAQVRELLECEREFRKIASERGGSDVLGQLVGMITSLHFNVHI